MDAESYTLGGWIRRWIDFYAPLRCKSGVTLERYHRLANYVINGATRELAELAITKLTELSHRKLEDALLGLLGVRTARKEGISRRSIRHLGGLLNVALNKAVRLDLILSNPMMKVDLPSAEPAEARSLTMDEVRRLRQVCRGEWTCIFVELALATGLRRGELLALTWADVHHTTRVLSVNKSLEETKRGLRLKHTKSGKSRRCTLPLSVMQLLPKFDDKGNLKEGLLFPDQHGSWRKPAIVSQLIVRRCQQAGIKNASLHSLRHTHASMLLSRGTPVTAVSARLGHCDPAVTLRIYAHALPPDDQRAADAWDELLHDVEHIETQIQDLPAPEPSAKISPARALTPGEICRLREVCRYDWTGLFVELALDTGCGRGELLALQWSDIDFVAGMVSIKRRLDAYGARTKEPKSREAKTFALSESTMLLLTPAKDKGEFSELIFPDEAGRWRQPGLVTQTLARRLRKAGIESASLQSLQPTHAVLQQRRRDELVQNAA